MRVSLTRETSRCSWMMRLDQQPASANFNGSGLPIPVNGSFSTASTSSRVRSAAFRSVLTQYLKSSRNSSWNTACRSTGRAKSHLPTQLVHRLRLTFPASGALQCRQQALGVLWGAQQVSRLQQAGQLLGWNQSAILGAAAGHNDNVVIVGHLVKDGGPPLPQTRVCSFDGHSIFLLEKAYSNPVPTVQPVDAAPQSAIPRTTHCPTSLRIPLSSRSCPLADPPSQPLSTSLPGAIRRTP